MICAYVSATVQTVANLMTEIFRLPVSAAEQEEPALVSIQLKEPDPSGNVQRLFAGLELQLGNCPRSFLRISKSHTWRCKKMLKINVQFLHIRRVPVLPRTVVTLSPSVWA